MYARGIQNLQTQTDRFKRILDTTITNLINNDLIDGYGFDKEFLEGLTTALYIKHNDKVVFKPANTKFVKAYETEVKRLVRKTDLSFEELGLLLYLSSEYTEYEDNYLKLNGQFLMKKDLIEDLHKKTKDKPNSSVSYYKKKILELEKKGLILTEPDVNDKRNKILYLSPHLFYKGKYIDAKVKGKLTEITKLVGKEIKRIVEEENLDIELNNNIYELSDDELMNLVMETSDELSA